MKTVMIAVMATIALGLAACGSNSANNTADNTTNTVMDNATTDNVTAPT